MYRTTNPDELERRRGMLPTAVVGFDPKTLMEEGAFCLVEGSDLALFEVAAPGVLSGHYFFESRGKAAVEVAKKFLGYVFESGVSVVQGLTPVTNRAALWMTRRLGFRMLDYVESPLGPMQISMMTKKDYDELYLRRQ